MIKMNKRSDLPFRKNTEGYFIDDSMNILARMNNSYLEFPGGGVDEDEEVTDAIVRETFEETGAIIKSLRKVGDLRFIWGETWAKSDKQKQRYEKYQGEDMIFFTGEIRKFDEVINKKEDFWKESKLMPLKEAIKILESCKPFPSDIKSYRETQLRILKELWNEKGLHL